jgi:hypothetical protein
MKTNSKIYDYIIISSYLFGSMYIFSNTLQLIDNSFFNNNLRIIIPSIKFITCASYGSICVYHMCILKP